MIKLRGLLRQDGGNAAVELALILPILIVLLAGLIDFGRAYFTAMELENAARAGAQYGLLNGSTDLAGVENTVRGATDVPDEDLTVNTLSFCRCPDGSVQACSGGDCGGFSPGTYISISASTGFVPIFPFADSSRPATVTASAEVRVD
jgi:hypothetical protein